MAFIPVENTAQVRMQFLYAGQRCENVYHVENTGAWDVASLQDLGDAFIDWWDTELKAFMPATGSLEQVVLRDLTTEAGIAVERTTGLPLVGTNGSPQLPNNVTVAVKWSTGLAGRSFRGRTYHIGMPENSTVDNTVSSGPLADLLAAYDALIGVPPAVNPDYSLVVVSLFHANAPRVAGVTTPILDSSIDPTIDSQRRRLPGRGT